MSSKISDTNIDYISRMAVLETTVKNLDSKVSEIQTDVKAIILTLSKQPSLEVEIASLKAEVMELKNTAGLWKWLSPTLTGVIASILSATLTFLVINYLQNSSK